MPFVDTAAFFSTFLDREKEAARRVVQEGIEDPVGFIFDQLKAKFQVYLIASPCLFIYKLADGESIDDGPTTGLYEVINDPFDAGLWQNVRQINANSQIGSASKLEPPHMAINEEIDVLPTAQLEAQLNDDSTNAPSSAFESTLIPSTSTDQLLSNSPMHHQQQQQLSLIQHIPNANNNCALDGALNGNGQDDQELSPHVKRPRVDTTPPHNGQSVRVTKQTARLAEEPKPTREVLPIEVNLQEVQNSVEDTAQPVIIRPNTEGSGRKRFTTLSVQCTNCSKMFASDYVLMHHLWNQHKIKPWQCPVKDCSESLDMDKKGIINDHIMNAHQSTTLWYCAKCPSQFTSFDLLSKHNNKQHLLGQYSCSFPTCTFTTEKKSKIDHHYKQQHKPYLVCQQPDCPYRTKNATYFKAHERAHLGIKPYHCNWPHCDYANALLSNTTRHIKQAHFDSKSKTKYQHNLTQHGNPKDYLRFVPSP